MQLKINDRWAPALYFVLGQAAWFACVMGAARGASYLGIGLVILLLILHLVRVGRPLPEVKLVATVTLMGGLWETALIRFQLLDYPNSTAVDGLAPLWLLALWAMFAAQFNTTYHWLKQRMWAAALLGAIAGPLSFRAGAALGAVHFVQPAPAIATLALGWAALLPLIVLLSRRWDGVSA